MCRNVIRDLVHRFWKSSTKLLMGQNDYEYLDHCNPHRVCWLHNTVQSLHWRHNDHDGVSNHQPHHCLLNRLFRRRSKKSSKLRVTGLCAGNSPGPVNSPHKGPVTRKMFPFDDVIMVRVFPHTVPTKFESPIHDGTWLGLYFAAITARSWRYKPQTNISNDSVLQIWWPYSQKNAESHAW